ncbi:MAG: hypothetical protein J5I90_03175 [Caldilineales bacterium]|nr:hypothetical protein [Caldilineales bacterium]
MSDKQNDARSVEGGERPFWKLALLGSDHRPLPATSDEPQSIHVRQLADLDADFQHLLVHFLLPVELLTRFDIDPVTFRNSQGEVMVHVAHSENGHAWGLRLLNDIDRRDSLIEVEMADTAFGRIAVVWLEMNDPSAPRFETDHTEEGFTTLRGSARRNIPAETAAMLAGLAPGQTRAGLGMFHRLLTDLEQFLAALHHYEYEVEPLYYHNAVLFERNGFSYISGRRRMQSLHEAFAPGGELFAKLDPANPFRHPAAADTIRGRSWAIHDGIWDGDWDGIKMLKRIGRRGDENTSPGVPW